MPFRFLLVPGWPRLLLLAVPPLLALGALSGWALFGSQLTAAPPPSAPARAQTSLALPPAPGLLVHVVGAVAHPGMYRLKRGDRVYAAIAAAGGLTDLADPARLPNLAGRLKDGEQVKVPAKGGSGSGSASSKVSLSSASPDELAAVPGFSSDLVQAVVDYRQAFGGFKTTRELVTALGMSQADYNAVKKYLAP